MQIYKLVILGNYLKTNYIGLFFESIKVFRAEDSARFRLFLYTFLGCDPFDKELSFSVCVSKLSFVYSIIHLNHSTTFPS